LFNRLSERVAVFNEAIGINRVLKGLHEKSEHQGTACYVERIKFAGPADPMDMPAPPEDGSEPPPIDEERKANEFKMYTEFAIN